MARALESPGVSPPAAPRRRAGAHLAVLAPWLLAVAILPGRASALTGTLTLAAGVSLAEGSGVELGGTAGLYGPGTAFPVDLTPLVGTEAFTAEVGSFFMPEVELPFGGDVFSFQIVEQGVPTQAFALTLTMPEGEFNPSLGDPALTVRMSRTFDGVPAGTGEFSLPLTTGQVQTSQCGSVPPTAISGSPRDPETGGVELVGAACITHFDGAPFGALFRIRLVGTLALDVPAVPALSRSGSVALGAIALWIGVSGLRAASPRSPREGVS